MLHTATAWIASAAPGWATTHQRATACMDLGTCFFILDDSPGDLALDRYADLERAASGAAPDPARPLQSVFAALFERLAGTGGSLAHYLALRVEFARALRRRHALRTGTAVSVAEYMLLRETTIYFAPWMSTWELLGGFVLSPEERALVAPAYAPANRWQVLENERFSVARDARTGTPNVVALHAAERGLPLANADREVAERADAELAAFRTATGRLMATARSPAVAAYLDALVAAVVGARRHNRAADPARYAAS
ncbi:MAG: hypothetical protein ABI175_26075 [Polyangiales bacterium]